MQPYRKREDLPGLVFSLTAPCLPAIMGGGNGSGIKIGDPEGRTSRQWTEKAKSRGTLDRCVLRARKCSPTPTKYLGVPASSWPAAEASRVSWVCRTEQDRGGEEGQVPLTAAQAPSQPGRDGTTTALCHLCQAATERGCCLRSTAEERAYGRPQCPLEVEKYLIIW